MSKPTNTSTVATVTILPTTRAYVMGGRWTGVKEVSTRYGRLASRREYTSTDFATQTEALAAAAQLAW